MGKLWTRKASVTVGKRGEFGFKTSGLRISFDVLRNSTSSANPAKVKIWNLNPDHRKKLQTEKSLVLILDIGYGEETDILLDADITKTVSLKEGPDIVTEIECGDGDKALRESRLDKSYKAGTNYKTIVNDVISTFKETSNTAIKTISAVKDDITQNGISVSGSSKAILDTITGKQDLEWNIQNNELQILDPDNSTDDDAVYLSKDTGLIGSPKPGKDGLEFTSLIVSTKILPGRKVKIKSTDYNGYYKILSAKYVGDTHGKPWYIECVGKEI